MLRKIAAEKLERIAATAVTGASNGPRTEDQSDIHPEDLEIAVGLEELQAAADAGDIPLLLRAELLAILTSKLVKRRMHGR